MWDDRYGDSELAYGDRPNDFLAENADKLTAGTCLCLAEGQGRNAVWLAQQGFSVTAVDQSKVGMNRAAELARERGVALEVRVADLAEFDLGEDRWDSIVSIFGHLPPALRQDVHRRVIRALKPGGTFLLEAYTPRQIEMPGTGGPADIEMLPGESDLRQELAGLHFPLLREVEREVNEGSYHHGLSAVVQLVAQKPKGD